MSLRESFGSAGFASIRDGASSFLTRTAGLLRVEGERGRTGRDALLAFSIRIASAALAYIAQVVLARWMGGFEYGIFVFVWVWVMVMGGLASLGLSTSAIRFVPEYRATDQRELLRGFLLGSRAIAVAVSTTIMLIALAVLWAFGHLLTGYYLLPAFLILACLPVYALVDVQDGIARGYRWIDLALIPPYILRPVLLLAAMAVAWAAGLPMTAATAAGSAVFSYWAVGLAQTLGLERRVARDVKPGPRQWQTTLWLKISAPILIVHGFELLLQNTDILVLSRYLAPDHVAVYFAALKTMGLVTLVHFAVGTAVSSRFSALNACGDRSALATAVREAVRWTFWPTLAGTILLLALGKPLLWLFGADFTAGYPVMFVLAAGFLLRAAMGPAEFVLNMLGEQKACAAALSLSAAANLALNFALIPLWGLYGAAAATSVSVAGSAVLMFMVARRRLGLHLFVR